jgi:hypothetical protein
MTTFTATHSTPEGDIITGEARNVEAPPIFCAANRPFWDKHYGWRTFEK